MPRKIYVPGNVLTASDFTTYVMNQVVETFATVAARDTAIPVPVEGMFAFTADMDIVWYHTGSAWVFVGFVRPFASAAARDAMITAPVENMVAALADVNTLSVYSGAAWSTIGPVHGAGLTWTPTWTQSATITKTVTLATYTRVGRQVTAAFILAATSAGTSGQPILFGLPVPCLGGASGLVIGSGVYYDLGGLTYKVFVARTQSTSTFGFILEGGASAPASTLPQVDIGDIASATVTYIADADA